MPVQATERAAHCGLQFGWLVCLDEVCCEGEEIVRDKGEGGEAVGDGLPRIADDGLGVGDNRADGSEFVHEGCGGSGEEDGERLERSTRKAPAEAKGQRGHLGGRAPPSRFKEAGEGGGVAVCRCGLSEVDNNLRRDIFHA